MLLHEVVKVAHGTGFDRGAMRGVLVRKRLAAESSRCSVRLQQDLSHRAKIASKLLPALTPFTLALHHSAERITPR